MVLAGVLIEEADEPELKKLGVKDSKQLTAKKRKILAQEILRIAKKIHVSITHPGEIDGRSKAGLNLNKIEAVKTAEIINALNDGRENIEVVVDCPSNNIFKWHLYLMQFIKQPNNLTFKVEHKADVNHVACSAASIIAKENREREITKLKEKLGIDFGSGYPSDPKTIEFVKLNIDKFPDIFRKSWQTYKNIKNGKNQPTLSEF